MEKKKHDKKTIVCRIPRNIYSKIIKVGEGDFKQGVTVVLSSHEIVRENPELKLMHDVDVLMSDLLFYYGENHYDHFSNFPSCFRQFLKRGFHNWKMLDKRFEKSIEDFKKDKVGDG